MRYSSIVSDIAAWIEENKYHNLKIEEIVERSGFSRRHLQRFFKEQTSMSIGTYSRLRRLSAAALALRITRHPVGDLSRSFGFDSPASFVSAFRNQFGVPPSHFREREEWSFEKMIPRYDFLTQINDLECRMIKRSLCNPFMSSLNLCDLTENIQNDSLNTLLITNVEERDEYTNNINVNMLYSICSDKNQSDEKTDWISVVVHESVENLPLLQNILYAGLLPSLGITRPRIPDMIQLKRNDNDEIIIVEYLIPCIQR